MPLSVSLSYTQIHTVNTEYKGKLFIFLRSDFDKQNKTKLQRLRQQQISPASFQHDVTLETKLPTRKNTSHHTNKTSFKLFFLAISPKERKEECVLPRLSPLLKKM